MPKPKKKAVVKRGGGMLQSLDETLPQYNTMGVCGPKHNRGFAGTRNSAGTQVQ